MLSWTGRQIGDFVIEEAIGRGGMGVVYAARQRSVARQVALKVIDLQAGSEGDFLQRFIREAEVIAMLEHIHALPVYSYGVLEDEFAYLAMRLLRHGTLADVLVEGMLPLDAYTRSQAAQSLHDLIAQGAHFDAVITFNDASALGAIDALQAANLTPQDVFIVSANHEQPINDYIEEGSYVRASVPIDPSENARLALNGIVKALAGSPVPEYLTLSSGTLASAAGS